MTKHLLGDENTAAVGLSFLDWLAQQGRGAIHIGITEAGSVGIWLGESKAALTSDDTLWDALDRLVCPRCWVRPRKLLAFYEEELPSTEQSALAKWCEQCSGTP